MGDRPPHLPLLDAADVGGHPPALDHDGGKRVQPGGVVSDGALEALLAILRSAAGMDQPPGSERAGPSGTRYSG